ncbi:MAG: Ger(x)C family spore germination protein [Clostridiaceae bacterium]|nr:Ger(x)C family spore germination protein [Clostridiaceae bacterium]
MKKLFLLLYIIIFIPFTTACWNYREVDQISIVQGFAIDKTEQGNYLLTFEVIDFQESGTEQKVKSVLIESEGETLMSAIRNSISKNFPKLYFGHTTVVIISLEVAREGVLKVLDFFFRDAEPRLNINLFVSENETAGEILKAKALTSEILSVEITNILDEQKSLSKALLIPAYEFVNALVEDGISGIMTSVCTVENNEEKVVKLCGTAIFKEDRLQGFINNEETYALSFILDEVKGGIIVANLGSKTDEEKISLEILNSGTNVKPVYKDNKFSIIIDIDTKVALIEHNSKKSYNDEEGRKELKKIAEEQLKNKIENIIKKIQREFGVDIFGFGNRFYKELPEVWKEQGEKWSEIYEDLEVSVVTNIDIRHTGLLIKPIKNGD